MLDRLDLPSPGGRQDAAARGPVVLLAHRPELLAQYGGHGADVVLSGHAHPVRVNDPRELVLVDLVRGADAR